MYNTSLLMGISILSIIISGGVGIYSDLVLDKETKSPMLWVIGMVGGIIAGLCFGLSIGR